MNNCKCQQIRFLGSISCYTTYRSKRSQESNDIYYGMKYSKKIELYSLLNLFSIDNLLFLITDLLLFMHFFVLEKIFQAM